MASSCTCETECSYKIEPLKHSTTVIGEGPHWDISTDSLYFVDLKSAIAYRYDYNEDKTYESKVENANHLSFIIPIENKQNQFAVGIDRRVCILEWDGKSKQSKVVSVVFEVEADEKTKDNRFNDAKADPKGRFYGGTMPINFPADNILATPRIGNLYRYDKSTTEPILIKNDIGISNGLTWNTKLNKFYYIDSIDLDVKEYDYDIKTGEIKNPKILANLSVFDGKKPVFLPDGMTIDTNGFLYVATHGGSKVLKLNPTNGKIEKEIKMPCEQITSAAFGGPNLDILFVTTASWMDKPSPAGQTFKVTGLDAKGLEMNKLKL